MGAYRRGAPPVCGRRNCADCGRWRPLSDFGRPRRSGASFCPPCRRARKRRTYQRERADPARLALRREYFRIYQEGLRRARGAPTSGPRGLWGGDLGFADSPAPFGHGAAIDPGPLAAHVRQWIAAWEASHIDGMGIVGPAGGGRHALALAAGVPDRRVYGVLHDERVHRVTADRLACAIGLPLATIYGGPV